MTVAELIEKLSALDPSLEVVLGPEREEYDVSEVEVVDEVRRSRISDGEVYCNWVRIG